MDNLNYLNNQNNLEEMYNLNPFEISEQSAKSAQYVQSTNVVTREALQIISNGFNNDKHQ